MRLYNFWNSFTDPQKHVLRVAVYSQAAMGLWVRVFLMYLFGMPELIAVKYLLGFEAVFFLIMFKLIEQELDYPAPWTRLDKWLNKRYGAHGAI